MGAEPRQRVSAARTRTSPETDNGVRVANKIARAWGGRPHREQRDHRVTLRCPPGAGSLIGYLALEQLRIERRPAGPSMDREVDGPRLGINEEVCSFNKGCYLGQKSSTAWM